MASAKESFKLHVQMIVAQDGVKKTEAPFKAWLEGPAGLQKRLGTPEFNFDDEKGKK